MTKTFEEVMSSLPSNVREAAEERGRELIREEITLQALRIQLELTQETMAQRLDIRQANVSKGEKRTDMLISTLRSYVEAMGGTLELVAHLPGRTPVILEGFAEGSTARK